MDIQLIAAVHANFLLLEVLAPAVRHLSGEVFFQRFQFFCVQFARNAAFRHAPELTAAFFHCENSRMNLTIDAVRFVIPVHNAALGFLRHPALEKRRRDFFLICLQRPAIQHDTLIFEIAVAVTLIEIGGQRCIEFQRFQLGRKHRKAVLARDQCQRSAVVPLHVKLSVVIHHIHNALRTGGNRRIWVIHGIEPDACTGRILLLNEFYHFSVQIYIPPNCISCFSSCSGR